MVAYLYLALGAVVGAVARHRVTQWAAARFGASFPYGTLIANLTGSVLLGLLMGLASHRLQTEPRWRLFLAVGLFGSYTTFSSFTVESARLLLEGRWLDGLFNLLGSPVVGVLAALVGLLLGRRWG